MKKRTGPLEGKLVLLRYTECDFDAEQTVCLVYQVEEQRLLPLIGVMDFPAMVSEWSEEDNLIKVIDLLTNMGQSEVYTPINGNKFFGKDLGYFDLERKLSEQGEIEMWCEVHGFDLSDNFIENLARHQITVRQVDANTVKILD